MRKSLLRIFFSSIGDSIVCVNMENLAKVHVHTNHPGRVIEKALTYGALTNLKIDNMRLEHHETVIKESDRFLAEMKKEEEACNSSEVLLIDSDADSANSGIHEKADEAETWIEETRKEIGFTAVCSGDGLAQIFKGMGVDEVIGGGQTMNPSTEDILAAIDKVNADNVFVFRIIKHCAGNAASRCLHEDKK